MKYYTIILGLILLIACDNSKTSNIKDVISYSNKFPESNRIPILDTTIFLSGIEKSNFHGQNLTDNIAKKTLYIHFKGKGYCNLDNIEEMNKLTDVDNTSYCVSFNEIFVTELNGNGNKDAIITYWLTPLNASGHFWQPHKAIIFDTDKGYKITNEEFIADNFAIDSVRNIYGQVIIFGYNYDCENHNVKRYVRARLKTILYETIN